MSYPSLGKLPDTIDPDGELEDNTIRSNVDGGYELTRQRSTRRRRRWGLKYLLLNSTDSNLLRTHEGTVGCADLFNWTHPLTGTTYTVRYESPIKYAAQASTGSVHYHDVTVALLEV